jgi:hypothetical protein
MDTKKRRWSMKYKKSINCKFPKGFSQKQHCKYGRKSTLKYSKVPIELSGPKDPSKVRM